jgi:predicted flavoprotein YhiN
MKQEKQILVIGGGAAGFFAAINLAIQNRSYSITILEKTNKLLSKVRISGGGRCNVTHHCFDNRELVKNYPRGHKELLQVFSRFAVQDTINWFREQGIALKTEDDGRMFPVSDSSQTIIDCFLRLASQYNIRIKTQCEVTAIQKMDRGFMLATNQGDVEAEAVICALGGHNKPEAYHIIKNLGHTIDAPIPSLFTLNLPQEAIKKELQGLSVQQAEVKIAGTKLSYAGPVLVTHWVHPLSRQEAMEQLKLLQKEKHKALPYTQAAFGLPRRLWEFLCLGAEISNTKPWAEISNKQLTRLAENLGSSHYHMEGKTTFKEEFVTCGGIRLKEIDFTTMQSKLVPGLFFCGETLNIDGITGGFNFQSAWSTAWICASSLADRENAKAL